MKEKIEYIEKLVTAKPSQDILGVKPSENRDYLATELEIRDKRIEDLKETVTMTISSTISASILKNGHVSFMQRLLRHLF